jgi:hypothetical protein
MKTLFAAVLTAGMLCMANSASAFELFNTILYGGGCGCEPACGPVQKSCGCDRGCRDRCHRDRCNRGCHRNRCCDMGCTKAAAPSCGYEKQAPSCGYEKQAPSCGCHRDRCHRGCGCKDRCNRGCGGCGGGWFSHWGGCGCEKSCGCDAGPIQK